MITLRSRSVHIHADRRLVFQILSGFGVRSPDGSATEVLREDGGRRLVRFTTPVKVGATFKMVTDEWVTLKEPKLLEFSLERGYRTMAIFDALEDAFELRDSAGCTTMTYHSKFCLKGGRFGAILGNFIVGRIIAGFMGSHLAEYKETAEKRAARSKLYPVNQDCAHE